MNIQKYKISFKVFSKFDIIYLSNFDIMNQLLLSRLHFLNRTHGSGVRLLGITFGYEIYQGSTAWACPDLWYRPPRGGSSGCNRRVVGDPDKWRVDAPSPWLDATSNTRAGTHLLYFWGSPSLFLIFTVCHYHFNSLIYFLSLFFWHFYIYKRNLL